MKRSTLLSSLSWDDLAAFLFVARAGGLSPASEQSGKSPATLGRRMHALEQALGADLFTRSDRGYALTAEGQMLLEELRPVEAAISRIVERQGKATSQSVKLSAGSWTSLHLIRNSTRLFAGLGDIRLQFLGVEAKLDISHRETTIGIRNIAPSEPALVARKLRKVEFAPYATGPDAKGWIMVDAATPSARWLQNHAGSDISCSVSAPRNALDLARQGAGIALLPTFIGDEEPYLRRVAPVISSLTHDSWLVTHQEDRHLPHVRKVINRLYEILI